MDFGCQQVKCISLIERTDKQAYVTKLLGYLGIPFEFFLVVKDKENTARGCFTSHITVIREAYNEGVQRLMVFEDDIETRREIDPRQIRRINRFLNRNKWEVFFLGGTPNVLHHTMKRVKGYSGIYHGTFMAAHAYIINRSFMKKVKDLVWDPTNLNTIDLCVLMKSRESYISFPRLFFQRMVQNDRNLSMITLKARDLGERFLTWYAQTINIKITNVLIVIIVALFVVILYKYIK